MSAGRPSRVIVTNSISLTNSHSQLNERLGILATAIVFYLVLSLSYSIDISKNWGYMGFSFEPNLMRIFISLLLLLALSVLLRVKEDTASFVQLFIFLSYICPSLVYFSFGGSFTAPVFLLCSGFVIFLYLGGIRIRRPKFSSVSKKSFLLIMMSMSAIAILSLIAFGGLRYFSLDPLRVYEFRRDAAASVPAIFGYIISPVSKVVLPIGILLGLLYRSTISSIIFIFLTIMMFGLTHHKSILVAPVVVPAVYWSLARFGITKSLTLIFIFLSMIILVEILYFYFLVEAGTQWFSTFIVRRVFFVPPLLDNYYIEFFSSNPFMYWSASRISFGLVETDYLTSAPFLIGEAFFGQADTSANVGFVGSGFANAGAVGVFLYAGVIGMVLSVLNAHGRHVGHPTVICSALIVVTSAITTSDLMTVLLTHGLLFLLICLSFMPKSDRSLWEPR